MPAFNNLEKSAHSSAPLPKTFLPLTSAIGFAAAISMVIIIAILSYRSLQQRAEAAQQMLHTEQILRQLEVLLSELKDAETGQRGFLLTGDESYLAPYLRASAETPPLLKQLLAHRDLSGDARASIQVLQKLSEQKLSELNDTIILRRDGDAVAALNRVQSGQGRELMDRIRQDVSQLQDDFQDRFRSDQEKWSRASALSTEIMMGGCALLLLLIVVAMIFAARDHRVKKLQSWLRSSQIDLALSIQGEQTLSMLGERVLGVLAKYLNMPVGVIYTKENDATFAFCAGYGFDAANTAAVRSINNLLTQSAHDKQLLRVSDVPENYLPVASGLGNSTARHVLIAPVIVDGIVYAVVELGFFHEPLSKDETLLTQFTDMLAVAMRSARDRTRLEALLSKTQAQAEELQMQQEELRVSNEELEEQSRALKESQAQLESQQAELEQINASLEEQTQLLSDQKSQLEISQTLLTSKAEELERVNQYKTEFLANMSHELRTPLNSSLIFAKLLADNKDGNLSEEQVRYAETIGSAGNDLLALINDILDLSKIEAGKMDVSVNSIAIVPLAENIIKGFLPLAEQRNLSLTLRVGEEMPDQLQTDGHRLSQILKNLLSNALKFTAIGSVTLSLRRGGDNTVAFDVVDTGIGIPTHQQTIIFEAFRQADGSTHRKYGGTGLGLSISRDLAHLLGGTLTVSSEKNRGSTFTLTLPLEFPTVKPQPITPAHVPAAPVTTPTSIRAPQISNTPAVASIKTLTPEAHARRILIIEDDAMFASILTDVAAQCGFDGVVVHTAHEGLRYAAETEPSAILLDMHLPDEHGLWVLDELKRNPLTRHIPVHILSVEDYTQEALGRGAIGYALKPAQREELKAVIQKLEDKLAQQVRRVLVVEDDARQLDSIRHLLSTDNVEITGVATAQAALEQLRATTFDCMVMDLKLPDLSGYELLQRIAEQDDIAFPPVIIYTGRLLTSDEEQQLRRFSKSIIIKDARSPERLLDEVTLFLHQVESALPLERQRMLKLARHRESAFEGRRILVVEDDARNIFALTSILEPKGATVEIARNGREAIDVLTRIQREDDAKIDIVLMDIMMPEMDGYTAMRKIREEPSWKKLPIIALTAKAMKDDQEKCLEAGANDYIAKPLDVDKLLSLLRVWMT